MEGRTIRIDHRWAEGKTERFPELAAELVRLKVDVLATPGLQATLAATVQDPVGTGIVASLARPGANAIGLSAAAEEYVAKWLELLKAILPHLVRVGVLLPNIALQWSGARVARPGR